MRAIEALVETCLQHRALVIFGVLLVGALGVRAAQQLPLDAVPDVTNVQVQVLTNAPAFGPLDVETQITWPIEQALGGIPHVEDVRSLSRTGISAITVVFAEGTDLHLARQLVGARLTAVQGELPPGVDTPALGPMSSGLGEIFQFEVRGEPMCDPSGDDTPSCYTTMELRTLLDAYLAPPLRTLDGVVEVNPFGGALRTWEVRIDPTRMQQAGVSLQELVDALHNNHVAAGGGVLTRSGEQRVIRGDAMFSSLADVEAARVRTYADGTPLQVRDVATVMWAPMLRQGAVTRDGRGEAVTASILMLVGAQAGRVAQDVREQLAQLAPGLPPGVTVEAYYDRTELVDRTTRTVVTNLVEGATLVVVVLLLLLGSVRAGLLVALVIPLSMCVTAIAMHATQTSANLMSLGALDFGLIIDGAIVVVEQIARRVQETGATGRAVAAVVRRATLEVIRPVLAGTGILAIVYLPVLTLEGVEGKMFRPMAIVVVTALGAATLLALTLIPAVSTWVFARGVREQEPFVSRWASRLYAPMLGFALRQRVLVVAIALAALACGGWMATRLGSVFLPTLDEGTIALQAIRPPSVALETSIEATTTIEQTLRERFPDEVLTVVSRTGRAEIATDPMGVEVSDIFVMLHPPAQWSQATDREGLVTRMDEVLRREVPGQNFAWSQPIALRTAELMSGVRSDVAVRIVGDDLATLDTVGAQVQAALMTVAGATDITADEVAGLGTLRVMINREAAARHGVDARAIIDAMATIGGLPVATMREAGRPVSLQIRLAPPARQDLVALQQLPIATATGSWVPLQEVASLVEEDGPAVVSHQLGQRTRTVQVNVRDRDLAGFVADAQRTVQEMVTVPAGVYLRWGGQFEQLEAARTRLLIAVPVALLSILVVLMATFGSIRPALLIYANVPLAAVGGIAALWIRGMPFSISAAIGFIALSGIAVLNGVVMVWCIRDLQRAGQSLLAATEEGARLRLRAVLMTALTDGIGFLPMALSTGAGAEVQQPLATVVIGGLVTSTWLTLFVLPALYSRFGGQVEERVNELDHHVA